MNFESGAMETTDKLKQLSKALQEILPLWLPCSEYELISKLREDTNLSFLISEPGDTYSLFQNHFLLFHVLYRLRDEWWAEQVAHLDISPLKIQYLPYQQGQQEIAEADPLHDFYLDLSYLDNTCQHDVDEMMGRFWVGMHRNEHRDEALAILGLSDPVDDKTIKTAYQKLVMQHHPDRGGDDLKLQELNLAMDLLKKK